MKKTKPKQHTITFTFEKWSKDGVSMQSPTETGTVTDQMRVMAIEHLIQDLGVFNLRRIIYKFLSFKE